MRPWAGREIEELSQASTSPSSPTSARSRWWTRRLPLYLGCAGVMGQRAGERYLKDRADLIIAVGQSFDEITTLSWDPSYAAVPLVVLDTDSEEVGKAYPVTAAAVGHLPSTVASLHTGAPPAGHGRER